MKLFYILLVCGLFAMPSVAQAQEPDSTVRILTRLSPSPRTDSLIAQASDWGGQPPVPAGITANLVLMIDDVGGFRGCTPAANAPDLAGNIAFIERGSCEFGVKALNAQNAGAIGFIVFNCAFGSTDCASTGDDQLINMGAGAVGAQVTIPGAFMSYNDAFSWGYYDLATNGEDILVNMAPALVLAGEGAPSASGAGLFVTGSNPTSTTARFEVRTPAAENVTVTVYNMLGQRVATLHEGAVLGTQAITMSTTALPAGSYFVRASGETFNMTQQITVVR